MTKMMMIAGLALGVATLAQAQPQAAPQTIPRADFLAQSKSQFDIADANHDGFLTKPEVKAVIAMAMGAEVPPAMIDQVFAALDTNGDGKATAAEVEAHDLARFDQWDTNHDRQLSRDEMMAGRQALDRAPPKP
ncbi:EF-hand domain-containing protein [Sphingomonas crusticola]|uniref:EF-hand domain-containing protein n=1 Tax=Sphingomonas crusticola TaxID=1697973 RepID=UPI0013C3104F|nr:EF-hand domain-containing protein [Sphingomonas crusticola]